MTTETTTIDPREATPNAGQATEEEAALIAAGTDTDAEGNPTDAAADAAAKATAEAEAKAAAEAAAAAAKKVEEDAAAAQADAARAAAPAPQPAAMVLPPKPEPPQDFAAERTKLKAAYDNGDLDQDDYLEKREAITLAEAEFRGKLAAWETTSETAQANAQAAAEAAFNAVALAWQDKYADFLANPLRADMMQKAIVVVDQQTGGKLSPAELFEKAQQVAFEATNYTPPAATPTPTPTPSGKSVEEIAREALQGRKPNTADVPGTLRTVPAAAGLDPNNASYTQIDQAHIDDAENIIARMSPDQLEKFLASSEGSGTRGSVD